MSTDVKRTWVESLIWDNRRDQPNPPTPGNPALVLRGEEDDDVEL